MQGKDHTPNDEHFYIQLGKNLKKYRKLAGLSQSQVVESLNITYQQYQKYEKAINRIPLDYLLVFCKLTGTTVPQVASVNNEDYAKMESNGGVNHTVDRRVTNNSVINNHYNYGLIAALLSKSFNMDINMAKNKLTIAVIVLSSIIILGINLAKFWIATAENMVMISNFQFIAVYAALALIVSIYIDSALLIFLTALPAFSSLIFAIYVGIFGTFFGSPYERIMRIEFYVIALIFSFIYTYLVKRYKAKISS